MPGHSTLRIRRSLDDLQKDYDSGNKKPLEDLMHAWKGIKELPPDNPKSFFVIGGYHGEPFRGAGWGNASYWGGYCNHGNVLFPAWHRVYLLKLEAALQSIPGCGDVMLPYWDETSEASITNGVPRALTDEFFELDGEQIPNPLRSFLFSRYIVDHISPPPDADYSKPKGYETVRYPLSGLVGTADLAKTKAHNAEYPDYKKNVELLNQNIIAWLTSEIVVNGRTIKTNVKARYEACLDAPNYTVFSNITSAAEWRDNQPAAVSLESPHNSIHLAVGGFDLPGTSFSPIEGANGDMGENDTAGLDPIFYFHHCFVDRVFWLWQKRNGHTDDLEIIEGFPGTNSVDSQGPAPGIAPNSWLTLDSPLDPFKKRVGNVEWPYTSRDCINIESQLGYSYGPGSLETAPPHALGQQDDTGRAIKVSGINRGGIRGSFLISVFANVGGERLHLGTEAVLSRWHVEGCANCQTHIEVNAFVAPRGLRAEMVAKEQIEVEVRRRDGLLGGGPRTVATATPRLSVAAPGAPAAAPSARPPFFVEVI
jgi:tyrosinase